MGCVEEIVKCAHKQGIKRLKIGVVSGDDILDSIDDLMKHGANLIIWNPDRRLLDVKKDDQC